MSPIRETIVQVFTRLRHSRRQELFGAAVMLGALTIAIAVMVPHLAAIVSIIAQRWDYAYELEWMEGGMLHHAMRVVEGRALYPEPGPEFMPFLYTPLYHWLAGAFVWISEPGLPALRALSLCGTLASLCFLGVLVRGVTNSWALAVGAVLLFVGTFPLNGHWFDIARVDTVAMAFSLLSLLLVMGQPQTSKFAWSGVFVALAFLTKQSTLATVPVLGLYAIARHGWRGAVALTVPALMIAGVATLALMQSSDGWYWYYTMELPATHGMKNRESLILGFWTNEVFGALPILSVLSVVSFASMLTTLLPQRIKLCLRFQHVVDSKQPEYWLLVTSSVALILGSYASRLHMGSYVNDLIPMHVGVIVLATILWGRLLSHFSIPLVYSVAAAAFAWHFARGEVLDVAQHVPTSEDRVAGDALVNRLRNAPGDVLVVNHPHFGILAGKPAWTHQMAMIDVFEADADPRDVRNLLRRKWEPLFRERRFGTVVADNDWYVFQRALMRNYRIAGRVVESKTALLPKTGTPFRPELILRPRPKSDRSTSRSLQ